MADTNTLVPGGNGTAFGDFPEVPSVSGSTGQVVFYAEGVNSTTGVYAHAVVAGKKTSLTPVVTEADLFPNPFGGSGGVLPIYLGFGANAFDGARQQAVVYAVLAGASNAGIYSVTLGGAGGTKSGARARSTRMRRTPPRAAPGSSTYAARVSARRRTFPRSSPS